MATPTIPNGEEYFFPIIYEGNGAGQRVGKFVPFTDNGTIDNSCIFNGATNNYLSRTPGSNGSTTTLTFSAWVKRGRLGSQSSIFFTNDFSAYGEQLEFLSNNTLQYVCTRTTAGVNDWNFVTNRTFEDTSKWYHIFIKRDTTNSTQADRVQIYVDGERVTSFSTETLAGSSAPGWWNQTTYANIMGNTGNAGVIRGIGYLAEVNMIDGTAMDVSDFGVTDTSTGRWIPKTLSGITYGTNGFRMKFQDSSALGDDTSGNGNDFTATNLASTDQTTDSPTQNHATINPNTASNGSMTFAQGNLNVEMNNAYPGNVLGTLGASSGKYYWEVTISGTGSSANGYATGVAVAEWSKLNSDPQLVTSPFSSYIDSRSIFVHNGATVSNSTTFTAGDVISIALNLDDSEISYFKNNTIVGSAQPLVEGQTYFPFFKNSTTVADLRYTPNFGQRSWNYTPPTDFVALQQDNLPETAKGISGLVWAKSRDSASLPHQLVDSSRGVGNRLISSSTAAEAFNSNHLSRFLKGGYATGDINVLNTAGDSMVAWNWVADSGTTSTNTDGSITSTVQANTTAGFSIVEYTGTGSNATVGHGLSTAPKWIWVKQLNSTGHFSVYLGVLGGTKISYTSTSVVNSPNSTYWNNTDATSSVFSVGTNADVNGSSSTYVAYCWSEIDGYSRFGSYTGNGNADGPFVYTGFKPAWIMIRRTDASAQWFMFDNKRNIFNPVDKNLRANQANAESTTTAMDFVSNGFKLRHNASVISINENGGSFAYMAFAEHPFNGDGTSPVTAR